jgi:hypothetical protein
MTPMVLLVLKAERELDIWRQTHNDHECNPGVILPVDPKQRRENRKFIFARIPRIGANPTLSPCGCGPDGGH